MAFLFLLLLFLLLLFPQVSVQGASQGLLLWSQTVLPTLAPFMICTQLIAAHQGFRLLSSLLWPIGRLFGFGSMGTYILFCGLLCGYPLGAKLCAQALETGQCSIREAQRLLSVCNHPSPMFLIGFVLPMLSKDTPPALLLAGMYLPILPLSFLARLVYGTNSENMSAPSRQSEPSPPPTLDQILHSTCETMVLIGGYLMLFSILSAWIEQLSWLSPMKRAYLSGFSEITTGIWRLCRQLPESQKLPAVVMAASFGGCSGLFQTNSVLSNQKTGCDSKNAGLSIRHYLVWKILHAGLSLAIVTILQKLPLALR